MTANNATHDESPGAVAAPPWLDRAAWPFAPHFASVRDGQMHYVDEGTGPMTVLVHGTPTWGFEWRHVIAHKRAKTRLIAPDHMGFGLSARPQVSYTPEAHATRFSQFMDQLLGPTAATQTDGRVHLVIHDFGGPIALDWALQNVDRLRHLTIVNTWMWPFDDDPSMRKRAQMAGGALGRFLYRYLNASQRLIMPSAYGDRRRLTPTIHRQYLSVFPDPDSREQVLFPLAQSLLRSSRYFQSLWDRRGRLAAVPMSVLWGERDSAFQLPILERWQGTFPHARVVRFPDAGHWPHEEVPAAFCAALTD